MQQKSSIFPLLIPIALVTNFALFLGLMFYAAITIFSPKDANAIVPTQKNSIAVIRALDKVTARVEELSLPIGKEIEFGTLSITAKNCKTTLPEETPPESAAYIDVEEEDTVIFSGWMFASSPALSAMEHKVYDIWVIGCKNSEPPQESEKISEE
ncbi:MAG: DUF2155 domain-containing protein [Alphaproteobacteria bacterium]|nr:DUF2155 domain-containing protein [Alphaproteobacteria bacterium]MCL2505779.1 DUF2155 domain-containing protein [Alphaproteobacteria bacterium]